MGRVVKLLKTTEDQYKIQLNCLLKMWQSVQLPQAQIYKTELNN